jgi:hypothetical protein
MKLFSINLAVALLALCATAHAVPIASFPDPHLVPGAAGQQLALMVSDDDLGGHVNMTIRAAVNGGGPDVGPAITDIEVDAADTDFGTTIFSGATFLANEFRNTPVPFGPQLVERDVEADDANETDFNGLAALLIFDTTGLSAGHHTIDLSTDAGDTAFGLNNVTAQATLTISAQSDLTNNLFVDFQDLTVLLANWGRGGGRLEGNLVSPTSTIVNFADLTTLLAEWTGSPPGPSPEAALAGAAVPEPSSLLLAVLGLMFSLGWRRRSRLPSRI